MRDREHETLKGTRIALIGAGAMGEALISGLLNSGTSNPDDLRANDVREERLSHLHERWGLAVSGDKSEVVDGADVLVLAVKPQDASRTLNELAPLVPPGKLLISVAAGIPIKFIQSYLSPGVKIIRTMPNTSCLVKESATAIALGPGVTRDQERLARTIFSSVGKVVVVEEDAIDAVTGLSGSGPAYVYLMIEALVAAGVRAGLEMEVAHTLAVQTVYGAAKMVLETGEDPASLRRKVMSPGGTTVEGLKVLEERGFIPAIVEAVASAARRSRELGSLQVPKQLGKIG